MHSDQHHLYRQPHPSEGVHHGPDELASVRKTTATAAIFCRGHPQAIIDQGTFDFVQQEMARRRALGAGKQVAEYLPALPGNQMRMPRMQLCTQSARRNRGKDPAYHTGTVVYWNCGMTKKKGGHCATRPSPSKSSRRSARMRWGFPPLTRRSLRSGLSALPSADSVRHHRHRAPCTCRPP